MVLSEGYQLYFGAPDDAAPWFDRGLGYEYDALRDGAVSDWLMDLVSVGFAKPDDVAERSMATRADVAAAAVRFAERGLADAGDAALVAAAADVGATPAAPKPSRKDVASRDAAPGAVADADAATVAKATSAPRMTRYPATYWTQFAVLYKRSLRAQLRNPTDIASRMLMSTWVGTLGGLVFIALPPGPNSVFQRLAILFFTMMMYELLPFCYMSLYIADRKFYAADVASGLYHPCAYYLAHSAAASPFIVANALVGGYIAYGLSALRWSLSAVITFGVLQSVNALVAVQCVVLCVYLTPNQDIAFVLATSYVAISILLGGFYIPIEMITIAPLRWLSYLSYPRYTLNGLARNDMGPVKYRPQGCLSEALLGATEAEIKNLQTNQTLLAQSGRNGFDCKIVDGGNAALAFWGFTLDWKIICIGLAAFYFGFHVLSYLSLSRLYKARR